MTTWRQKWLLDSPRTMYPNVPGIPEGWDLLRVGIPNNEFILLEGRPHFFTGEWDLSIPAVIITSAQWEPFHKRHHARLPCKARARQNKSDPWVDIILAEYDAALPAKFVDTNGHHYKYVEILKGC